MRHQLEIQPRDVLFFRDARPMGGSSEGAGASWPMPGVFYSAVRSALLAEWPQGNPELESTDHKYTDSEKKRKTTALFGGLRTLGPFPQADNEIHFPIPLDVEPGGGIMQPVNIPGSNNLPKPLRYAVASTQPPSKKSPGAWVSATELKRYLKGEGSLKTTRHEDVFASEARPGVGIDPKTHANIQSVFYQAEYLRLQKNATMTAFAECRGIKRGGELVGDVLDTFFSEQTRRPLVFGGQRGIAYVVNRRMKYPIAQPEVIGTHIKWILLTPALFMNGLKTGAPAHDSRISGWLPGWVDAETGKVRLKGARPPRSQFKNRKKWREAVNRQPDIAAKLVAARIGKPIPASGWRLDNERDAAGGAPKATRLFAPAGSVYYFECGSEKDARNLAETLHGQVKSDLLGEQGYGFGVCGIWEDPHTSSSH